MGTKIYADIELMTNPVSGKSLVNKDYVDAAVSRKIKDAVTAVSAENFEGSYDAGNKTLTQTTPAVAVIDGVELAEGDRVLLAGQTDAAQNGIYAVITAGSDSTAAVLARAEDFNDTAKIVLNVMIPVQRGEQNADTTWVLTNDTAVTLDTTALMFSRFKCSEGAGVYTATFTGDGIAKSFPVNHGLNTENVVTQIVDAATKGLCIFNVLVTSANVVTVKSDTALPAGEAFIITVMG